MDAGNIKAKVVLDISNYAANMKKVSTGMSKTFGRYARKEIRRTNNEMDKVVKNTKNFARIVKGILAAQAFYRTARAISNAAAAAFNFTNNMTKARIAMEYFLGSQARADAFLNTLKDFAAITPFVTEQAVNMSRRLMAMGFAAKSVVPTLEILTDAASATGGTREQLDRVVLALGQMKTNGRIAGQELRQLAEASIPVYTILKEELGLTAEQLKNIGDYKISGDIGVAAVLSGLQKRYEGAAEKISNTIPGMLSTIQDDSLLISEYLLVTPFKHLDNFIRSIRDKLEDARSVLRSTGLGGLFEHLVPAESRNTFRLLFANFIRLGKILSTIGKESGKVFIEAFKITINLLNLSLPILQGVLSAFSSLLSIVNRNAPAFKALIGILLALFILSKVTTLVYGFRAALASLALVKFVAVNLYRLAGAIKVVGLALAAHPLVLGIALVLAGLTAVALTSDTASRALDTLKTKIGSAFGVNPGDILKPTFTEGEEATEEFNKDLDLSVDKMTDLEKKAQAAKRALASFDEVFTLPDEADASDALEELFDTPEFDVPGFGVPELDYSEQIGEILEFGSWWDWLKTKTTEEWVPTALDFYEEKFDEFKEKLLNEWIPTAKQFYIELGKSIARWQVDNVAGFIGWALKTQRIIRQWIADRIKEFPTWIRETGKQIETWAGNTLAEFNRWSAESLLTFINWSLNNQIKIASWALQTREKIKVWGAETYANFVNWSVDTQVEIAKWVLKTKDTFNDWVLENANSFINWSIDTQATILTWSVKTGAAFTKWATENLNKFINWNIDTTAQIATWAVGSNKAFNTFIIRSQIQFADFFYKQGVKWSTWSSSTRSRIKTWALQTGKDFTNWQNDNRRKISGVLDSGIESAKTFGSRFIKSIRTGLSNITNTMSTWADNLYTKVFGSLDKIISKIKQTSDSIFKFKDDEPEIGGSPNPGFTPIFIPPVVPIRGNINGGFFNKEHVARFAEGDKPEGVIPTANPEATRAVVQAMLDAGLKDALGTKQDSKPTMYVHTLIADKAGLRKLYKEMDVVRVEEERRKF